MRRDISASVSKYMRYVLACLLAMTVLTPADLLAKDEPQAVQSARPEILEEAWWNLTLGAFATSARQFNEVISSKNAAPAARAEAWFGLGTNWAYRPGHDHAKAVEYFRQAYQSDPAGPYAAQALLAEARLIELNVDAPRLDEALEIYQRILREFPDRSLEADEVIVRIAANRIKRMDESMPAAVADLLEWADNNPQAPLARRAYLLVGMTKVYPLEDYAGAVAALRKAADYPLPQDITGAGVLYQVAYIAHRKLNDTEVALKYYVRLLEEMAWDERVPEARRAYKDITGRDYQPRPIPAKPAEAQTQEAQP